MNENLRKNATDALIKEFKFIEKGKRLMYGICPWCNQKQLWTFVDNPWAIKCNRTDECQYSSDIKTLYPELFENYTKRFKEELKVDPNAAAKAYLIETRGFAIDKCGDFKQGVFAKDNNTATATVRYQISPDVSWERFIDDVERFGKQKANFRGEVGGLAWLPPKFDAKKTKEIWIVEGIFDAIALTHAGIVAISAMTANNYPEVTLKNIIKDNPDIHLVIALDCGATGHNATKKWCKKALDQGFANVAAAAPGNYEGCKDDWNDLFLKKKLTDFDLKNYRHYGALIIAKNRSEKARAIWLHTKFSQFYFEFDFITYWFSVKPAAVEVKKNKIKEQAEKDGISLTAEEIELLAFKEEQDIIEIANCSVDILYSQNQKDTDERLYYLDVKTKTKSAKAAFTTKQLNTSTEFKNKLMNVVSGCLFKGKTFQLDEIYEQKTKYIKDIETIPYIGYCASHEAYVYQDFAVKNGIVYKLNKEDYFNMGKQNIKTTFAIKDFSSSTKYDEKAPWFDYLVTAFGNKGIVSLAYWVGSLFAEQMRAEYKTFPFLEMTGEAGSGKSTIIEFLWKLVGFANEEGFNPSNSTQAGFMRKLNQVSNLPIVLIEGDTDSENKGHIKTFNVETLKSQYNGRSPRVTGQKNTGNTTDEEPFRGSIVISQNEKIQASEAIISRICYLNIDRSEHSLQSKKAAEKLERYDIDSASGFLRHVLKKEKSILQKISENYQKYDEWLSSKPEINMPRIAKNHAQMMALIDALTLVVPITNAQRNNAMEFITSMAIERQQYLSADHPIIDEFWDVYEYLESSNQKVNHSKNEDLIAVSMEHFNNMAKANYQKVEDPKIIKKYIKKSVRYKYVNYTSVASNIFKKSTKCFLFKNNNTKAGKK